MSTMPIGSPSPDDLDEWGRIPRQATERTQGVWTACDDCGEDWWCVVGERDWMDEPVTFVCSGGCADGWDPRDLLEDDDPVIPADHTPSRQPASTEQETTP